MILGVFKPQFPLAKVLGVLALSLMLSSALAAEEPDDNPEFLIKQLQHEDFDRRRVAAEKLAAMGELARAALEKAANTDDVELKEALAVLTSKLDKSSIKLLAFDRDGKPATGAEADVRVYNVQSLRGQWSETANEPITINADGTGTLKNQAPGQINLQTAWRKWSLLGSGAGYHSLQLQRGVNPVIMTLSSGGSVSCDILDDAGKPVKDAQIVLYSRGMLESVLLEQQLQALENWDRTGTLNGFADEKGKATVETVNDGVYQVVIKSSTHTPLLGPVIRVREREKLELPAFKLTPRNLGKLQVLLQVPDGGPLKKTRVALELEYQFEGPDKEELQRTAKKLASQINMNRQADTSETDDDGKLTIENLKPGKYTLKASANNNIWQAAEFTVAPNQTLDLGALKTSPVGTIKGKILTEDGKGMQYSNVYVVPEKDVVDANEGDLLTDWRFVYRQHGGTNTAQSNADGVYELKSLLPGKYILTVSGRTGQQAVIYGLEVTAGKETLAKDLTFPGKVQTVNTIIKGTVLLPDGKPAGSGAMVSMFGPGRWGRNTDEKGNFDYSVSPEQGWVPTRLTVKMPKYKPAMVDLTASGIKLDAVTIKLEKQEYGDLRVKVVDENQKPVSNVLVSPVTRARNNGMPVVPPRTLTNKRGEVRLNGLAAGERTIQLQCEGYFCDETTKVMVLADRENEVTVTMKSGRSISGHVQIPEGVSPANIVVYLTDNRTRVSSVDEKGRFEFTGLGAGTYFLTAGAPGLVTVERLKLELTASAIVPDSKIVLKLERPWGAVIAVDPIFKGWSSSLSAEGSWDPERKAIVKNTGYGGSGIVDAAGRAEFWSVTPGSYDLVLNPAQAMANRYRWYETTMKRATASLIAGPVNAMQMQKSADLKEVQPTAVNVKPGTGSVTGRVICENVKSSPNAGNTGSVSMRIISSKATASLSFNYPSDFAKQKNREPIIIGTPPAADKKPAPSGSFTVSGLPAGEYRVYVELNPYRYNVTPSTKEAPKPTPAPVARFTLKDGEKLELPEIKFQPPEDLVKSAVSYDDWQNDMDPEDMIPVFQP